MEARIPIQALQDSHSRSLTEGEGRGIRNNGLRPGIRRHRSVPRPDLMHLTGKIGVTAGDQAEGCRAFPERRTPTVESRQSARSRGGGVCIAI